ncbi:hypothetical protein [Catenuloplanes indicus]|uniref:Uncharacterized protein n=1 Tax=Catenuloplanes indicus TaxID=137267 RepID=A0AAE3W341_9ACTN|nr:hypothetical protein [Catenuloplanes indicus]MDQ0367480.1 hypothetical protein [Catenuloplanes indicus]
MAIEWSVRVNQAITIDDAAHLAGRFVGDLLGEGVEAFRVEVVEATCERLRGGSSGPVAPDVLTTSRDPFGDSDSRHADVVFRVPALPALAYISMAEHVPRDEDPESGMFVTVSSARSNESQVLAIAAASAFAELAAGDVIDESGCLGGERFMSPRAVIERLGAVSPASSVAAAVDTVLARTTLRRDYQPLSATQI